jgi:hypothetical protein
MPTIPVRVAAAVTAGATAAATVAAATTSNRGSGCRPAGAYGEAIGRGTRAGPALPFFRMA